MRKQVISLIVAGTVVLGGAGAAGAAALRDSKPVRQMTAEATGLVRVLDPSGRTEGHDCAPAPAAPGS